MKTILLAALTASSLATAHAGVFQYGVTLNGANESPVNASSGMGTGSVIYDDVNHTLQLQVDFSGLMGTVTAAHIHAPTAVAFTGTAGVATTTPTFAGFPSGVSSGTYANTLNLTDASSYNLAFMTANGGTPASAESALAAAMAGGQAYWNIHSSAFPGGEIRGFLVTVPEPGTLSLLAMGALGMAWAALRKRA